MVFFRHNLSLHLYVLLPHKNLVCSHCRSFQTSRNFTGTCWDFWATLLRSEL